MAPSMTTFTKNACSPPMSQILLWATQVAEGMFVEVKSNDHELCIHLSMHAVGSKGAVWSKEPLYQLQVNLRCKK